jgi:indole-3-glycerol phosphate synthase
MNELERIVARTRRELSVRSVETPRSALEVRAAQRVAAGPPGGFDQALAGPGLSVIAEHKRRSPSAGMIRDDLTLEDVVGAYARGGAAALSILTEHDGFGGTIDDLQRARAAATLPILRKDFIVDSYQVIEALAAGADAILLIVAALSPRDLAVLSAEAQGLGLGVLVEVHDERELEVAIDTGSAVIGINNRDLATLAVDTSRTFQLAPLVPVGTTIVSESGWRTAAELAALRSAGVDAVLVGEGLMRAEDIEAACRALTTPQPGG